MTQFTRPATRAVLGSACLAADAVPVAVKAMRIRVHDIQRTRKLRKGT